MEKLPMCRLCLAENVRMYVVVNKDLHELYERLTDNPFVTGDSRPMLACFICCTKLKQCCQLQRKCLEAEELLTQMVNEDYELNSPFIGELEDQVGCFNGLILSPMVHVSIESDDESQTECDAIKEELPAVCERLDDVIEPEEEHQSDEIKLENLYSSYIDAEDIPTQQFESDSEDVVPIIKIKTEVEEEQEVSSMKRSAGDTTRAAVAKEPKLYIRRKKLEDVITENQMKNEELDTKVTQNTSNCTSKLIPKFQEPLTNTAYTTLDTNCRNNIKKRNLTKRTGRVPYKCDICQRSFNHKGDLIKHIRVHTGEKPFKCNVCQRCFSDKSNLSCHIRTHTGDKPYKCEECQRCFIGKNNLTRHFRTHTGEKPFKCKECELCFRYNRQLKSHVRTHITENLKKKEESDTKVTQNTSNCTSKLIPKFQEPLTNTAYTTLDTNCRNNIGGGLYKCDICQRNCKSKDNLIKHIRVHNCEKPFKCEECELCFRHEKQLKSHIHTHITENIKKNEESDTKVTQNTSNCTSKLIPKFQVPLTNTAYTTLNTNCRNNIKKRNLTKRTGRVPYKCDICQRSFNQKGYLIKHIRVHTGEKPFKCKVCQRCFSDKSNLTCHIRTHTGDKPYKCEECQRCFKVKNNLTRHFRTHTNEKPFKCEECELCFRHRRQLKSHIRMHITENLKKNEELDTKVTQNTSNCTSKLIPKFQVPLTNATYTTLDTNCRNNIGGGLYKCDICQRNCKSKDNLIKHIRVHNCEKPFKCEECELCFRHENQLKSHIHTHITENIKKNEESDTKVTQNTSNCTSKLIPKFQVPLTNTAYTTLDTKCRNNIKKRNLTKRTGRVPYKCDICQRSFNQKGYLIKHIRVHTGEKPFKCKVCQRCFSDKSNLTCHIRTHTGDKPYKCEECQRCFKVKNNLTRHFRTHTNEKPFKCEECELCFRHRRQLKSHIRMHITENLKKNEKLDTKVTQNTSNCTSKLIPKFQVPLTNATYTTLDTNCRNNIGGGLYKCDICQRNCKSKDNLIKHIRVHNCEKPFKCEECELCFRHENQLKSHIHTHITENIKKNEESDTKVTQNTSNCTSKLIPKFQVPLTNTAYTTLDTNCRNNIGGGLYKCDICQRYCRSKDNLIQHIRVHTSEKPFKCKVCQRCYSSKNNLNSHIRMHTGEKSFKCYECERCFNCKSHLTEHIRTHTGDKPFKCEECELCFRLKCNLTRHIRTHTGEKPYKCEECELCFSRKRYLTQHIRTHTHDTLQYEECELYFSEMI